MTGAVQALRVCALLASVAAFAAGCDDGLPGPLIGPDAATLAQPGPDEVAYAPGQRWRCTHRDTVAHPTVDVLVGAVDADGVVHASLTPSFSADLPRAIHAAFTQDGLARCAPRLIGEDATPFPGFANAYRDWTADGRVPYRISPAEAYWQIVARQNTA